MALRQLREGCLPESQLPAGWEAVRFPGAAGQAWAGWVCAPRNSKASGSGPTTRSGAQLQAQPTGKETAAREQAEARQRFCESSPTADELDLSLHWALGWCIRWLPQERPSMWQLLCWATGWLAEFEEKVLPPPREPLPEGSVVELLRGAAETAAQEG